MERNCESSATMEASIVVKVKYGDVLRRFRSWISDDELDVSMDGLEEKILSLFNLPQNISLMLAYIDEDGDEVALVDDDDLRDVVKQGLNPLRVTVKPTAEKNGRKHNSSGTSTPLKLPQVQKPFQYKKTAPEPLCETLVKLSTNFASKVSSSGHDIAEFINYFSEVSLSYLAYISESQPKMQTPTHSGDSEKTAAATEMKASETSTDAARSMVPPNVGSEEFMKQYESLERLENESLEKVEPLTTVSNNAVRHGDTSVVSMKDLSVTAPGFNVVGLDSQITNAGQPVSDSLQNSVTTGQPARDSLRTIDTEKAISPQPEICQYQIDGAQDQAPPQECTVVEVKPCLSDLDSYLVRDVNIFDDTVLTPLTSFTKIWRMRNTGVVAWPQKTQLVWTGGDKLGDLLSVELKLLAAGLAVGQNFDVAVDFITPETPGRYMSHWRMASPLGQAFGQHIWVHIQVKKHFKRRLHRRSKHVLLPLKLRLN